MQQWRPLTATSTWTTSQSPQALAEYLDKLDKDDELYNSYFRWKNTGYFMNTKFWCRLCAMVHGADFSEPYYYRDVEGWWRNQSCVFPTQTGLWSSWTNQIRAQQ
jgi:glycoprotein 3-alpha-L-fucosyltransferase